MRNIIIIPLSVFFLFSLLLISPALAQQALCEHSITGHVYLGDGATGNNLGNWSVAVHQGTNRPETEENMYANATNVNFTSGGLCANTDYLIVTTFENDTKMFYNWTTVQANNQSINLYLSGTGGVLSGYVWTNETNESKASRYETEVYNGSFNLLFKIGCPRENATSGGYNNNFCHERGLRHYTVVPTGTYYIRAILISENASDDINVSKTRSISIAAIDNTYIQNVTGNLTGTRMEMGSMDFRGMENTGLWITYMDANSTLKIKTTGMDWGEEAFAEFFVEVDKSYNVSVESQLGYLGQADNETYNTSIDGRIYLGLWNSSDISGTSSVSGMVIDDSGQPLNGASIKAYIMSIYNSSEPDPWRAWDHKDWKEAKINSTTTGSDGKFTLILPSPSDEWIVRYAMVAEWDNSSTPGADYIRSYDRNGWRGYDFSGNRIINNSNIQLSPGATVSLTIYQPDGTTEINSTWIRSTYGDMGDRLWWVGGRQIIKKIWGYESSDHSSEESRGGNFQEFSKFTTYAPIGNVTLMGGLDISQQYLDSNPNQNSSVICIRNITISNAQKGTIISVNCTMETYYKLIVDTGDQSGEFIVIDPISKQALYPVHEQRQSGYILFLKNTTKYNFTFIPHGPPTFAEIYNHNVTSDPTYTLSFDETRYNMDIEVPETLSPGQSFNIRMFPRGQEPGIASGLNVTYDLYYTNETFYQSGSEWFDYNNISMGPKTKEYYNLTLSISEAGGYIISLKAGNLTGSSYTYSMDQRDLEVWNTFVKIKTDKWRFTRGESAVFGIMTFNGSDNQPLYDANYSITLFNPETRKSYNLVSETPLTSGQETAVNFTIPEYLQEGWYRISVEVTNSSKSLKGRRSLWFHLTNMNFIVNMEKFEIAPDEDQKIYIIAKDREGNAIANMSINATDLSTRYLVTGTTDSNGEVTLTIPYTSFNNQYGWHEVEIDAYSPDGKREKTFEGFVVIPVKLFIDKQGKNKFKPGENISWKMGLVSLQDGLTVPPDEECMPDGNGICQGPGLEGMQQMTVNKGDLIPGPPIEVKIYYPNGSLYYEEEFSDFDELESLNNPVYDISSIAAGDVKGRYKVSANLMGEITTKTFFDVITTQIKAYPQQSVYTNTTDEIIINVYVYNYTSDPPAPINGETIKAKLYSSTGANLTDFVQNTTNSNGFATIKFIPSGAWTTGVLKAEINATSTSDIETTLVSVNNLIVTLDSDAAATGIDMNGNVTFNVTLSNGTDPVTGAEVEFKIRQPEGREKIFTATELGNGNYSLFFDLDEFSPSGKYLVRVSASKASGATMLHGNNETSFTLNGYELEVFLNREGKPSFLINDEVSIISRLTYSSNSSGAPGIQLTYELRDIMRNAFMSSNTTSATDSDGVVELTLGPQTADVPIDREGFYLLKISYKTGDITLAREDIAFMISNMNVVTRVNSSTKLFTSTDSVYINVTASNGSAVPDAEVMMFIKPPSGEPYEITNFENVSSATATVFNTTIGPLTTEGKYVIVAGVETITGSFGDDFIEIWVQNLTVNTSIQNMTYTEGDNVTMSINVTNASGQVDGSATIRLMERRLGVVNTTTVIVSSNGLVNITYLNKSVGAYMAEIEITGNAGEKGYARAMFGVKPNTTYSLTTKDSTGTNERKKFKSGETVSVDIAPSLPSGANIVLIKPDDSTATIPATSTTLTLSSSYLDQTGWYVIRLDSSTVTGITGTMIQVT